VLRQHWPEYLIEAWALGTFMVSAGIVATLLGAPASPLQRAIASPLWRNGVAGIAMGLTAIALIHSPWGKRSGAHMNPAVTLAFLRLRKVKPGDALFFILAQVLGATAGVLLVAAVVGRAFSDPPVSYAVTLPGPAGAAVAFAAELAISLGLMLTVLMFASSARFGRFTGLAAGALVAAYVAFESPLSGMSMNPARSFASAAAGMRWQHFWIYVTAPLLGMITAAQLFLALGGVRRALCGKLLHPLGVRCIHCGYEPGSAQSAATPPQSAATRPGVVDSPTSPRSARE
jgi:aquaporin Z